MRFGVVALDLNFGDLGFSGVAAPTLKGLKAASVAQCTHSDGAAGTMLSVLSTTSGLLC
jgi:hypothetical protein